MPAKGKFAFWPTQNLLAAIVFNLCAQYLEEKEIRVCAKHMQLLWLSGLNYKNRKNRGLGPAT